LTPLSCTTALENCRQCSSILSSLVLQR